jgi:hypothetical protein
MKHLITSFTIVALLALPTAASAQNTAAPGSSSPAGSSNMMNCPMATGMPAMRQNMAGMMSQMQAMAKDTQDPVMKERMQKMHERMSAMMANMQQMDAMRGMMMGGQQPGAAAQPKPDF